MPYDKGDFTQQGIDGYVNGGLLLNNKRDINARLSTDEETEGIDDVDIVIKDHLNDLEYHITGENLVVGNNVIGGGSGGGDIPHLTVHFLVEEGSIIVGDKFSEIGYIVENNIVWPLDIATPPPSFEADLQDGEYVDFKALYNYDEYIEKYFALIFPNETTITPSNVVNCAVEVVEPDSVIVITDPSANSTITLTYKNK